MIRNCLWVVARKRYFSARTQAAIKMRRFIGVGLCFSSVVTDTSVNSVQENAASKFNPNPVAGVFVHIRLLFLFC